MINIQTLGSSSAGNCYLIDDSRTKLLLECGLPFKQIQRGLDFRLSVISGVLISHEHKDHCRSVLDVMKAGMDIYASKGTAEALGITGHRMNVIQAKKQFTIGTWTILPFDTIHDAAEPLGFLLQNEVGEKLLFATDTCYLKYIFAGLSHILIECNLSFKILNENIASGRVPIEMKNRLIRSHMSLETLKTFLMANDLSKVCEIWLLHLSDNNSDAAIFKREVQEISGKPVYIADR